MIVIVKDRNTWEQRAPRKTDYLCENCADTVTFTREHEREDWVVVGRCDECAGRFWIAQNIYFRVLINIAILGAILICNSVRFG